jgi:hypothetical protein
MLGSFLNSRPFYTLDLINKWFFGLSKEERNASTYGNNNKQLYEEMKSPLLFSPSPIPMHKKVAKMSEESKKLLAEIIADDLWSEL